MAQLFDFKKVTVGPRALVATVELAPSAPLMTGDDPAATDLVLDLLPGLLDHVCLGDVAPTFGEVAQDTELAHLLEHVAVELLAQTNLGDEVSCGQTAEVGERTYEVTLGCPDDVLVVGALSSAAWILQWAFSGGGEPKPDVPAIVSGLVSLVESVSDQAAEKDVESEAEFAPEFVPEVAPEPEVVLEPEPEVIVDAAPEPEPAEPEPQPALEFQPESEPEPEPAVPEPEPEPAPAESVPAPSPWDMDDVPRPHLVR